MEGITIKDIVAITGGTLLCGDENKEIKEFAIDSRQGNQNVWHTYTIAKFIGRKMGKCAGGSPTGRKRLSKRT